VKVFFFIVGASKAELYANFSCWYDNITCHLAKLARYVCRDKRSDAAVPVQPLPSCTSTSLFSDACAANEDAPHRCELDDGPALALDRRAALHAMRPSSASSKATTASRSASAEVAQHPAGDRASSAGA
jgi:hypothetical protein